jgi:DNA-binding MarR family transcriptional regulator
MVSGVKESHVIANELRPVLLRLARELRREIHSLGVTGGQVSILAAIKHEPGITASAVADRERVSAPAMSNHVDRLERHGLVQRTPSPSDRRRVGLSLTDDGQRVLRKVRSQRTAWLATRLKDLTLEQLAAIDAAIEPLSELLP